MEFISYIIRFLFRIKWWLIIVPLIVALIVIQKTKHLTRSYEVKTTIYTGVMSGYSVEPDGSLQNMTVINNTMDNLINIITAKSTLRQVSMRLFAQDMIHGDPNKDNDYILAQNYRHLLDITPQEVKDLIDKNSEEKTLKNLFAYADANTQNFLYGLFNWSPPYYSYNALSQVKVSRLGNSDMVEIKYIADDPGIAYHTLDLLNDEFMKQYEGIRYGETDKVIRFFEMELAKTGTKLKSVEDSLTDYNIQKRIINYDEQTKHLAALSRDFELQNEEIVLDYNSSKTLVQDLEKRIGEKAKILRSNRLFIDNLNQIAQLSAQITRIEAFQNDSISLNNNSISSFNDLLKEKENEFKTFSDSINYKRNTKESYSGVDLVGQWISELLRYEESKAKLEEMNKWKEELDNEYVYYSPIGSTIKRKEREINFTEASYLEILSSLNTARLRQKSVQMTSASLKVLNPPTFPLGSAPTKRKMIVIASTLGSFIFILGYFLLLEILDRTLRDKIKTERLTSGKVIAAFPGNKQLRHRGYTKIINEIAAKSFGNSLLRFFKPGQTAIIGLLSIEKQEGKSFLANQLINYYTSIGFDVRTITWHEDFSPNSKEFIMADNFGDLSKNGEGDILIIEYPPLREFTVPQSLLKRASVNLLVARANRTWKDTDKTIYANLLEESSSPIYFVLNQTRKDVTEYFTGLLPPYTFVRKFIYRILQLGFRANELVD